MNKSKRFKAAVFDLRFVLSGLRPDSTKRIKKDGSCEPSLISSA